MIVVTITGFAPFVAITLALYYVLFRDDLGCILGQLVGVFQPVIFGAIILGVCRDEKCGKIWRKKNPKKSYKKLAVKKL